MAVELLDFNPNGWHIVLEAVLLESQEIQLEHDNFYNVKLYYDSLKTQEIDTTNYQLSDYNEDLDAYNKIVFNSTFFTENVGSIIYADYYTKGDFVEAEDVNSKMYKYVEIIAYEQISKFQTVCLINGQAQVADSSSQERSDVIGIQITDGVAGKKMKVQIGGQIYNPAWNFTPGAPLFLQTDGSIGETIPYDGYNMLIGYQLTSSTILITQFIPYYTVNPVPHTLVLRDAQGNSIADKLSSQRTIQLTGDVTGSTTFDGTSDVSITQTVQNDSHTHSNSTITSLDQGKITSGILPIAHGGTSNSAYTANKFLVYDGSKIQSTNYDANSFLAITGGTLTGTLNINQGLNVSTVANFNYTANSRIVLPVGPDKWAT